MTRIAPYLFFIGTFCLVLIECLLLLIHFFQCSISGIIDNHSHCIIPRRVGWDLLHQAKQKCTLLTIMRNTWLVNTFFSQTRIKLCHFTQFGHPVIEQATLSTLSVSCNPILQVLITHVPHV